MSVRNYYLTNSFTSTILLVARVPPSGGWHTYCYTRALSGIFLITSFLFTTACNIVSNALPGGIVKRSRGVMQDGANLGLSFKLGNMLA